MTDATSQFITRMKLRELTRQRELLRAKYDAIAQAAGSAPTPAGRLRALYDGLRGLTLAGRALHPEVLNLDPLLREADAGGADPDLVALRAGRLEQELGAGRRRTEFVTLFGSAVEEAARDGGAEPDAPAEKGRLVEALRRPGRPVNGDLFGTPGPEPDLDGLLDPIEAHEAEAALTKLADDPETPATFRAEAKLYAADATLLKELADALTIMVADLDNWRWPEGDLFRAVWTRNKWRLRLSLPLPDAVLLEVLADRWRFRLMRGDLLADHVARLAKLEELNAPEVILENERRLVRSLGGDPTAEVAKGPKSGSVAFYRASARGKRRERVPGGGGYGGDGPGHADEAVSHVHAEVQLLRAAFPDRPVFVAKADVADFFASVPHDAVLGALGRSGVPESRLGFFRTFLAVPLPGGGAASRGVPTGALLSGVLAELLMQTADEFVEARSEATVVRLVDDVGFVSPDPGEVRKAFAAFGLFCDGVGLSLQGDKCGAVAIGGELPEGLPNTLPHWGMLELRPTGQWGVHRPTFERHVAQGRERSEIVPSVLGKVRLANLNAKFLAQSLSPALELGADHRREVAEAAREFHGGVAQALARLSLERFGGAAVQRVPEAWVLWPETAGGLGLLDARLLIDQYQPDETDAARPQAKRPPRRDDWQAQSVGWGRWYEWFARELDAKEPEETPVTKTLTADFIQRGGSVSGGRQTTLSPYWKWVLAIYGPQILESFGTFRFLITELVPLRLVGRERGMEFDD